MAWFIPLDVVTLWTVGVIVAIFIIAGIVCLIIGLKEREWPETPGEVISYFERPNDDQMQYFPTFRMLGNRNRLPPKVTVTRGMLKEPEIGSQWIVKHHPEGKKVWVKGETPGTMTKTAGVCFFLALLIPFAVLGFIDWEAS